MQFQLHQVIMEPAEIQYRNIHHRNWGAFKVIKWKNGLPQWYITSFIPIAFLILFYLIVYYRLLTLNQKIPQTHQILLMASSTLSTLICLIAFHRKNPNISSTILPLTDDSFIRNQINFCIPCKLIKQPQHYHCHSCKVCFKDQYFHSMALGCCVTSGNCMHFMLVCLSLMSFCVSIFL